MTKIGIIGLGFVGSAIKFAYENTGICDLILLDSDPNKNSNGNYETIKTAEAIFICVPSPMNDDGTCNTEPLESVLENLKDYQGVIISKVTAPPDVYNSLQEKFPNLVHSPEFLTAANATYDYCNGKFCIIGGSVLEYKNEAARIIKIGQRMLESIEFCSISEASLAKYMINSFLATKVIFMNEMYDLSQQLGLDWKKLQSLIRLDKTRIGTSHDQVPGPDGHFGFGGACFPKDVSAIVKTAEKFQIEMNILNSAMNKNILLRLRG